MDSQSSELKKKHKRDSNHVNKFTKICQSRTLGPVWIQSIFVVLEKYHGFVKYFGFRVP